MKQIAHVNTAANGQNKVVAVELAEQVVAATKADVHACHVRADVVAVFCTVTNAVDWRHRRRSQQPVQRVDASVGYEQRAVSVALLHAAAAAAASAALHKAVKNQRAQLQLEQE